MSEAEKFDKAKYTSAYSKEHYENLNITVSKDKHLKERIKAQAERAGISYSQWALKALERELEWYE